MNIESEYLSRDGVEKYVYFINASVEKILVALCGVSIRRLSQNSSCSSQKSNFSDGVMSSLSKQERFIMTSMVEKIQNSIIKDYDDLGALQQVSGSGKF